MFYRVEIAVRVEQRVIVQQAKGSNHYVDSLTHGDALSSQRPVIASAFDRNLAAQHFPEFQRLQQGACFPEVRVVSEILAVLR